MSNGDTEHGWVDVSTMITNDAAITDFMAYSPGEDHTVLVRVAVVAQRYDGNENDEVFSHTSDHIYNVDAGAAVLRDSTVAVEMDPQATGWRVLNNANAATARIQVQGSLNENVRWMGRIEVLNVEQEVVA